MIWAILPWIVILLPFTLYKARYLNILRLGDQLATGLGTAVERKDGFSFWRRSLLPLHAWRRRGHRVSRIDRAPCGKKAYRSPSPDADTGLRLHRRISVLLADTLARNVLAPSEIPVGLVISVLGAPYFIYLLMKAN